jgi:hypothetical protein
MWLFCCGMYRSGSTLQYQIAAAIVETGGHGRRVEWCPPHQFAMIRDREKPYGGIRIFKSHEITDDIRELFTAGNARGLYIYRDLRDVIASLMIKDGSTFKKVLRSGIIDQAIENHDNWTGLEEVHVSRYEEVMQDLVAEIIAISEFLRIPIGRDEAVKVAAALEIDKQKSRAAYRKNKVYSVIGNKMFDPDTLLHVDHIHDGQPGKWQYTLSTDELLLIDRKYGHWLRAQGYYDDIHIELDRLEPCRRYNGTPFSPGKNSGYRNPAVLQRKIDRLESRLQSRQDAIRALRRKLEKKQGEIDRLTGSAAANEANERTDPSGNNSRFGFLVLGIGRRIVHRLQRFFSCV